MSTAACTICARNYLAQARVFATSFRRHHPDARIITLVLDDADRAISDGDEPFEVLRPDEILPSDDLARMCTAYGLVEFATSVKPALLEHLMEAHDAVAYFDPDIQVFGPLDDVFASAATEGMVLTPHSTLPLPTGGHGTSTEDIVLDAGVFNLGFIAVGRPARDAVRWWDSKLRRECIIEPTRARFVDQRWVDLFPAYFEPMISRDPGLNVAWWNLPTRDLRFQDGGLVVDRHPLRFFHFSGYDPERPWMLSTHQGPIPRVLLSERPELELLTTAYRSALFEHGYTTARSVPYALASTPEGMPIDARMRKLYRYELTKAERSGNAEPPRLFDQSDSAFVRWLAAPDEPGGGPWPVGRYLHDLWRGTPALRERFPDPHREDAHALVGWAVTEGVAEGLVPTAVAAALVAPPPDVPQHFAPGMHLIVASTESPGHALIADDIAELLGEQGIPVSRTELPPLGGPPPAYPPGEAREVNVFIVPPEQLPTAIHLLAPSYCSAPANVALIWSQEESVHLSEHCLALLDEIWALTDVRAEALRGEPGMPPVEVLEAPLGGVGSEGTLLIVDCATAAAQRLSAAVAAVPPDTAIIAVRANQPSEALEHIQWIAAEGGAARWVKGNLREAREAMAAVRQTVQVGGKGEPPVPERLGDEVAAQIAATCQRVAVRRRAATPGARARLRRLTGG